MSNFNLTYHISKKTPASPKVLKEILDTQTAVNRACTWTHERLALAAPKEMGRASLAFPFMRFGHLSGPAAIPSDGFGASSPVSSPDAFAQGSTRVRDNLWNAHLVAAFLRYVSRKNPTLVFGLRDEGGFVIPGSVWIRGGMVEADREFLNRERARALELTGDPQAAAPYVYAEIQGLGGNHFLDTTADEYGDAVPEIREMDVNWDRLGAMSLTDVASLIVERAAEQAVVGATA